MDCYHHLHNKTTARMRTLRSHLRLLALRVRVRDHAYAPSITLSPFAWKVHATHPCKRSIAFGLDGRPTKDDGFRLEAKKEKEDIQGIETPQIPHGIRWNV